MLYLLFIITTLLIAIVYSIQTKIWQSEQYHLENKYPPGKNKHMDKLIEDRNDKMPKMVWSGFVAVMIQSILIAAVIFGILLGIDHLGYINFLTR
ncbi:hypothetical protein N9L67_00845 [Candidatus Pelagibacter bacterium]|nr:hypothetical protein [Candidatus Pelagibacter bacterium]